MPIATARVEMEGGRSSKAGKQTVEYDNVFAGFAVEQGLTESVVGIMRGAGAVFGVLGTLIYPVLRQKFGLKLTGVITFSVDVTLLVPCVVSVFVAGSPFIPDFYINPEKYAEESSEYLQVLVVLS